MSVFKYNKQTNKSIKLFFLSKESDFFFCLESKEFVLFEEIVVEEKLVGNEKMVES